MRAQRFGLPARLTLAGTLVSLALPAAGIAAQAKAGDISLSVHVGYQNVIKIGGWMPVTVDAKNAGPDVDGTLEIQESLSGQPGVTGLTTYTQPVSLASGVSKRIRLYADIETGGATVTARILQGGRVLASQDASPGSSTTALIAVLSDEAAAFDEFAAIHPGGIAARVVHLHPDEIADSAIPLRAFDILAIDDFATDSLTARQRTAIADYVNAGGYLLIGTGGAWHKTLAGLTASILPMQVSGTTVVASPALGASSVELATGPVTNGHAWLSQNSYPLLVERSVGTGTVTMATFDWTQQPVAINAQTRDVMRQVMARAFFGPGGSAQNFAYGIGGPGFGLGSQPSVASKSNALTPVLGNLPGLDLPSLQLTGVLVLLYVLIVGPVNYIVLGALHRRALAWVTVPVIAVMAAAGAYGAGVFTKGRSVQINQVAILHLQPGWDHAYEEIYTGVIPPSRGDYEANVGGEALLISPIANANGWNGSTPSGGGLRVNVASNGVILTGMTAFSLGGFATESITTAPPLTAHFQLVNGQLTGTIENHSRITFSDAVLIAGDSFQPIPALKPGSSTIVSLTPKPTNAFGPPLYARVYNGNFYGGPGTTMTAAQRDQFAKTQILSLLPTGVSFKGIAAPAAPLLVAWTHDAFQSVTVNGTHPRSTAMSAVVLSLPVDQIAAGTLPGGIVPGRIVDVVGDSSGNGPPGMLMLQNGSVTYEFAPRLAAGVHLSGVSVSAANPYMAGPAGSGSPSVTGQVWDWSHGAWIDLAYQNNGTTAIPDNAIDPASGSIRLRLSTTNSGFLAGTITLSGTVQ